MKMSDDNRFGWLSFTDYIKWILLASFLCLLINGGWILTILGILFIFYGLYRKVEAEYYYEHFYDEKFVKEREDAAKEIRESEKNRRYYK